MASNASPQNRGIPREIWIAVGVLGLLWLLSELRGVLSPIFFALMIAYMLDPVVDRLEAWRIPRAVAIVLLLALVTALLLLFLVLVLPGVIRDVSGFVSELPGHVQQTWTRLDPWLRANGVRVPHSWEEALRSSQFDLRSVAEGAIAPLGGVLKAVAGTTASAFSAVVSACLVPVFSFYLLYDFDRMRYAVRDLVPWRYRATVIDVLSEVDETLGHFVRGQLILMAVLGTLYAVSFAALGVRLAVPIGIFAGLLSFIPYVGSGSALGLGLLMSLLDIQTGGAHRVVGVLIAYVLIQAVDGVLLTPKIVGGKVGLSAVWVLIALLVGGGLFGFLGVLLAVPTAAVAKILVRRAVERYRGSRLFLEGRPSDISALMAKPLGDVPLPGPPKAPPVSDVPQVHGTREELTDERNRHLDDGGREDDRDRAPGSEERPDPRDDGGAS